MSRCSILYSEQYLIKVVDVYFVLCISLPTAGKEQCELHGNKLWFGFRCAVDLAIVLLAIMELLAASSRLTCFNVNSHAPMCAMHC